MQYKLKRFFCLDPGIFGNVSYQLSMIYSFVWLFGCYQSDLVPVFIGYSARHYIVHAAFVWGRVIRSTSLSRVRPHGTIIKGVNPLLGSVLLIPTTLDAYCMRNDANTFPSMEGFSADFISFVAWIASSDASLRLDRSDSLTAFAISVIYTTLSVHVRYFWWKWYDQDEQFGLQSSWINSERKDCSVNFLEARGRWCGYDTDKSKCKWNSDPS